MNNIIIENKHFALTLREDCVATSLIHKESGQECLDTENVLPLFTLTEERPFDNNIKLAHPNKRMTFGANRVKLEGNRLICGFEMINSRAAIELNITPDYIGFKLDEIISGDAHGLCMDFPPACELRFLQLPIKQRKCFGEWLNVCFDDDVAINVLGTHPLTKIDAEKRRDFSIMSADALRDVSLKDCSAALIVSKPTKLLDIIEKVETDYSLPQGVKSRRSDKINRSCYWTSHITPANVDEHIEYAHRAGLTMMLIYYSSILKRGDCYDTTSCFEYSDDYPNGFSDLEAMIKKLNAAGITVGLHILHTHIGFASEYVTPVADHRLRLKDHYTLSKAIGEDDTTIFVEESTEYAPRHEKCKILRFGGEIIKYGAVQDNPPAFLDCERGYLGTYKKEHCLGEIGGVLDVSEFCATSAYIDQKTSLQDEIAEKIASVYSAGFEFIYYDGSEGANPPFEIYIPLAQYRVYKKLDRAPLYCEGAAKSHFSWHMLSGGNAFDAFGTKSFKQCIELHPAAEAVRMKQDFTRLNFGWWMFREDTQADIFEFGTSRAAAFDCPGTMMENIGLFKKNKRTNDILEVLRRWEYARKNSILTAEDKERLKSGEHTLIIDEKGEYRLCECFNIRDDEQVTAFYFNMGGENFVSIWHKTDKASLSINANREDITYFDDFGKPEIDLKAEGNNVLLPIENKRYIKFNFGKAEIESIIKGATVI